MNGLVVCPYPTTSVHSLISYIGYIVIFYLTPECFGVAVLLLI